jgi:hypothetical protein
MDRSAAGFYHDPPLWFVSSAYDFLHPPEAIDFDAFRGLVALQSLANGIEVKVTREGLVGFSFAAWPPAALPVAAVGSGTTFEEQVEAIVRRTQVMNSFLAFLYTNEITLQRHLRRRMVVTPELVISMEGLDDSGRGFGNTTAAHLAMSSFPSTYQQGSAGLMDDRLRRPGPPVPLAVVEKTLADLSTLMADHETDGVQLVDLFLRASKAHQDHNYSAALINYWAISEKLLQERWQAYQQDNKERDGELFISGHRRKVLNDGRSFTASVIAEFLSFAQVIEFELYEKITAVRQARNKWMHSLTPTIGSADARTAGEVCEALLYDARGLELRSDAAQNIHG